MATLLLSPITRVYSVIESTLLPAEILATVCIEQSIIPDQPIEFAYTYEASGIRQLQVNKPTGLHIFADILRTIKLEPYVFLKNNLSNHYAINAFDTARLKAVYEILGSVWIPRYDWKISNNIVIFINKPKGDLLFVPFGNLQSILDSTQEEIVPIWVGRDDNRIYKNITITGELLSFNSSGPWEDTLLIDSLPKKCYVKKLPVTQNTFYNLSLFFDAY